MKKLVKKGQYLENVVYKTKNVVIQQIEKGEKNKRCIVIGNGHSLSVDEENRITLHDPGMSNFSTAMMSTVYAFYFTFECSGLLESSKEIADFVNNLPEIYEEVILVGHSKCGLCVQNAKRFITRKNIIVTISAPFDGTIVADKNACESKLKYSLLIKLYNDIFSDHNVDKDIVPNSEFIKKMNLDCVDLNIISSIRKVGDCTNFIDLFLLIFDRFMGIKGDGIVSLKSQTACLCDEIVNVNCSHATSLRKGLEVLKLYYGDND